MRTKPRNLPVIEKNDENFIFDAGQTWLITRMQSLGYNPDPEGICFGLAYMAMQALLLGEVDVFNKRLHDIANVPENVFSELVKSAYSKQNLNQDNLDSKLSDVLSFFDSIELYCNPEEHSELFEKDKAPRSQNPLVVMPVVMPEKLEKQGGIITTTRISGIYTADALEIYFQTLREAIENEYVIDPIVFILNSGDHTITVSFDPKNQCWWTIDPERMPVEKLLDERAVAEVVMEAFTESDICTFSANIYATGTFGQNKLNEVIERWQRNPSYQDIHDLEIPIMIEELEDLPEDELNFSVEINLIMKYEAVDSRDYSLLYTAASANDLKLVCSLLKYDIDVNNECIDEFTPLMVAIQDSSLEVVSVLLEHNEININLTNDKGLTPFMVALIRGQNDIIKKILEYDFDVNVESDEGDVALFLAIKNGNLDIVKELVSKKADLHYQNKKGFTAMFFAANHGHTEIVAYLLEHNVAVDISSLIVAAKNSHFDTMKLLLAHLGDDHETKAFRISCAITAACNVSSKQYNPELLSLLIDASDCLAIKKGIFKDALRFAIKNKNLTAIEQIITWAMSKRIPLNNILAQKDKNKLLQNELLEEAYKSFITEGASLKTYHHNFFQGDMNEDNICPKTNFKKRY